ncbi:MAG: FhaA domain-containing protein [Lapillicoccus sp.]
MGLIQRVEQKLERVVNGVFAKAFKSDVQPVEIAAAIRRAMDDRAAVLGHGRTIVPNLFTVELSPSDHERLTGYADALSDELIAAAQEHAESQHYQPGGPLQVHFAEGADLETGVFRVRPVTSRRSIGPTTAAPQTAPAAEAAQQPGRPAVNTTHRPWLDIDGERYPLVGPLTVVGRDDAADIILDDPGISRRHTEIRVTSDGPHLVSSIRDLGSTNGTFVNGQRITSQRLADGDQVSVGRTSIVFRAGKR